MSPSPDVAAAAAAAGRAGCRAGGSSAASSSNGFAPVPGFGAVKPPTAVPVAPAGARGAGCGVAGIGGDIGCVPNATVERIGDAFDACCGPEDCVGTGGGGAGR